MNNIFYRRSLLNQSAFPYVFRLPHAHTGNKNQHVETLRGIAIILVVFGHMIGYTKDGGMGVSDDSIFRYLYYSLEYVRLPLFTVISGWVYANKPVTTSGERKFIKGKFRRLLIPMFVISTLLFVFRMVIPGTNTKPEIADLPRNLLFPYDVYWFLFSLFLIFLTIVFLDKKPFFHTLKGWTLTTVTSFVLLVLSETVLAPLPNIFSFRGAAYLLPFFLLGIGIHRYAHLLLDRRMIRIAALVFITGIVIQQIIWFGSFPQQDKISLLGMAVGLSAALLLFRMRLKNPLLIWIGGYAYGIFLFHVFFTGGSRIILLKMGIESPWIILFTGVVLAVLFSIMAIKVAEKSEVLRLLLLGLKKHEK